MKKTTTLATIAAATLMGSALCHAQDASKQFAKIDADKNGSISLEEMKAAAKDPSKAEKSFARTDADKNGSVSPAEFAAAKAKKPKKKKAAAPAAPAAQ